MSQDLEDAKWIAYSVNAGCILSVEGENIHWQKCMYIVDDCSVVDNIIGYVN